MPIKSNSDRAAITRDNRSFWRVSDTCEMDWRLVGEDPVFAHLAEQRGVMKNISGGGVCFRSKTDPGVGAMIALSLDLPGLPTSVLSLGRTVWTKPEGGAFEVGVEFWWIGWKDEDVQQQIRSFIARKLKDDAES